MSKELYANRDADVREWQANAPHAAPCDRCHNSGHYLCDKNPCPKWPAGTAHAHPCGCYKSGGHICRKQRAHEAQSREVSR